ncbi:MAG TPA: hypothetical protein VHV83_05385 [Armatimonadota bacterium]|nr:hypothetical protein [Armatimonadota bacterium]
MNWLFWVLLIVALLLLFSPMVGLVTAALRVTFWVLGALLLIAAIIWAISTISRAGRGATTVP